MMMMMMIIIVFLSIFNFKIIINYKNDDYYYYDDDHDHDHDGDDDDAIVKIQTKITQTKQIIFSFIFHFYIRNFIVDRHYSFIRVCVCITYTYKSNQTTGNKMFFSFFLYKFIKFYRWYINLNGRWNRNEMGIWIEFFWILMKKKNDKTLIPIVPICHLFVDQSMIDDNWLLLPQSPCYWITMINWLIGKNHNHDVVSPQ